MNLDSLNKWLTLAANIGVIAGIIFLGLELNQNTTAVQSASRQESLNAELWVFEQLIDYPALSLRPTDRELSAEQKRQNNNLMNAFFRIRENLWFQYKNGVLDESTWVSYRDTFVNFLNDGEGIRSFWERISDIGLDRNFVEEINRELTK